MRKLMRFLSIFLLYTAFASEDYLATLKQGHEMKVIAFAASNKPVTFLVPLDNFGDAFNGAKTNPPKTTDPGKSSPPKPLSPANPKDMMSL